MVGSGSASAGLTSMSNTLASFSPIKYAKKTYLGKYGIGLAIGLLVMFTPSTCGMEAQFGLAAWLNCKTIAIPYCRPLAEVRPIIQ